MTRVTYPPSHYVPGVSNERKTMTYSEAYSRIRDLVLTNLGPKASFCLDVNSWHHANVISGGPPKQTVEFGVFISPWASGGTYRLEASSLEALVTMVADKVQEQDHAAAIGSVGTAIDGQQL